jgi:hypothetical protein
MHSTRVVHGVVKGASRKWPSVRHAALGAGVLLPLLLICPLLLAEGSVNVTRVEEDWEVVLNQPNLNVNAPQFHTVCSPYGTQGGLYLQVCWNYRDYSEFAPGGLQLITWLGDWCVGKKSFRGDQLSTFAETISWTQAIQTNGSLLTFEILNGHSQTWGDFGGSEISLSGPVEVSHLNGYRTDFSVDNSWISYGANRVNLLRIKEVRKYDANGNLISRDATPRIVFELQPS